MNMSEEFDTNFPGDTVDAGTWSMDTGDSLESSSAWDDAALEGWDQEVDLVCDSTHDACMDIVDSAGDEPQEYVDIADLMDGANNNQNLAA